MEYENEIESTERQLSWLTVEAEIDLDLTRKWCFQFAQNSVFLFLILICFRTCFPFLYWEFVWKIHDKVLDDILCRYLENYTFCCNTFSCGQSLKIHKALHRAHGDSCLFISIERCRGVFISFYAIIVNTYLHLLVQINCLKSLPFDKKLYSLCMSYR